MVRRSLAAVGPARLSSAIVALRGEEIAALVAAAKADRAAPPAALDARLANVLADALLVGGDAAGLEARALETDARAMRLPEIVCDAASVRAFAAANAGDLALATELARRASMMSRTEALAEQETLANVILARVRRLTGRPFLAMRILNALARYAAPSWRSFLGWEIVMAGGVLGSAASSAVDDPATALARSIDRLCAGDRPAFTRGVDAVIDRVRPLAGHLADVRRVRAVLDPDRDDAADLEPAMGAWRSGLVDEVPFGLVGIGTTAAEEPSVLVLARPGRPGVRMLGAAAASVEAEGARRLPRSQRRRGRTDTALAVLSLAGAGGIREEELFRAVYGFAFSHNVHRGVLDVLLHRIRAHLGDAGEIVRHEGTLAVAVRAPLLLVDPRATAQEDERVLQLVAKRGRITAKDTSAELGIPLRSAQAALEELMAVGACTRERVGRTIEYRVDDTTFQEPTNQRS